MSRILITGGRGALGSALTPELLKADQIVRVMSRQPAPAQLNNPQLEWAQADLNTGEGMAESVQGIDTIVHAATDITHLKQTDLEGTKRLLNAAAQANVRHFIYISITGIDRMPKFFYYRAKLDVEELVKASGVRYTIARITQFHTFVDVLLSAFTSQRWLPFVPVPTKWQFQTIDPRDAAKFLVPYVLGDPIGRTPDVAGPEVMRFGDMAHQWMRIKGIKRPILSVPLPIGVHQGLLKGWNTVPHNPYGTITWTDFLQAKYGSAHVEQPQPAAQPEKRRA